VIAGALLRLRQLHALRQAVRDLVEPFVLAQWCQPSATAVAPGIAHRVDGIDDSAGRQDRSK